MTGMQDAGLQQSNKIRLQTVFLITGKLSAMLATFAVPLVLTRLLTKNEFGIYSQFYVIVFFCTGFFSLATQSNLYYFFPTVTIEKRRPLVFQTFIFLIISALLTIGILAFPQIARIMIGEGDLIKYKSYILGGIFLLMPVLIIEPLAVVKRDIYTNLIYPPSEVLLRLSLVIGLVIFQPGLHAVFNGIIIAGAACLAFVILYTIKEIGISTSLNKYFDFSLAKQQLHYSIPFGMAASLNILFQRFDKILCISFLTPSQFAVYSIAYYGIPGIMQIFDSLTQVYLIQMTIKHQENKTLEIKEIYKSLVTKTFSFSFPSILIVLVYARKIISVLFTAKYLEAVPLFRVYLISIMIFMLCSGLILRATGKTNYTLRSYLYSAVVAMPLTYLLVRSIGMWGAMTGALISLSMPRFLNLAKEMRILESNFARFFPWKAFGRISLISALSIIPFIAFEVFFNYGIMITALLGILYLAFVSLLEMKFDLFPIDSAPIKEKFMNRLQIARGILMK